MASRVAVLFVAMLVAFPAGSANPQLALPGETFSAQDQLAPLQQELGSGSFADAAARLGPLLRDQGDNLLRLNSSDGLTTFAGWVAALPADQRKGVTAAYRVKWDADDLVRFDELRKNPAISIPELYAFARHYPLSSAAPMALARAAEQSLDAGDTAAALTLFDAAIRLGWTPDARHVKLLDTLRNSAGTAPDRRSPLPPLNGPLPFDAPWFTSSPSGGVEPIRIFPFAAEDRVYFNTGKSLLAIKESAGQVLWSTAPSIAAAKRPPGPQARKSQEYEFARVEGARRPGHCAMTALADDRGRPQVLLVRQQVDGADQFVLRAVRAADGKVLWSTDTELTLKDLSFAGTPLVCGKYVYAVALAIAAPGRESANLALVALDTSSGQSFWQTTLGTFTTGAGGKRTWLHYVPWSLVWEGSEPTVDGDLLYVAPGAGIVAAVGRFDGKIRWERTYPSVDDGGPRGLKTDDDQRAHGEEARRFREAAREARAKNQPPPTVPAAPLEPGLARRYGTTPHRAGEALVIAPGDALAAFAYEPASGRTLWSNAAELQSATLIGNFGSMAIFGGYSIIAIDGVTGESRWQWQPPPNAPITGPAVVRGDRVLVPTLPQLIVLDAASGQPLKEPPPAPNFRRLLQAAPAKKALQDAGIVGTFGTKDDAGDNGPK